MNTFYQLWAGVFASLSDEEFSQFVAILDKLDASFMQSVNDRKIITLFRNIAKEICEVRAESKRANDAQC